jgi:hypothetical protein
VLRLALQSNPNHLLNKSKIGEEAEIFYLLNNRSIERAALLSMYWGKHVASIIDQHLDWGSNDNDNEGSNRLAIP